MKKLKILFLSCLSLLLLCIFSPSFATISVGSISTLVPCDASTACNIINVPVNSVTPGVDVGIPTLKVQDWGNASAPNVILFLHGFPHNHSIWVEQINQLDKSKYRVVTMDIRGQGSSYKPPCQFPLCDTPLDIGSINANSFGGYHSIDFANDIKKVIAALNLSSTQKLFIVGHSYGANIINDYINAYGTSKLSGIIYVASGALFQGPSTAACSFGASFKGPALANNEVGLLSDDAPVNIASTKAFLDGSVFNVWLDFYIYPKEPEILSADMMVSVSARAALAFRDTAPISVYGLINKPVLFIHGLNDQVILPGVDTCIASLLPSGTPRTLKFLNYTGHFSMFEQADQFNNALMSFIAGIH